MRGSKTAVSILAAALLAACAAAPVLAGDEPIRTQRIWAPVGDEPGAADGATVSLLVLDAYGDAAKGAEDWRLLDETAGSGLLLWRGTGDGGCRRGLRAYGASGAGGLSGRYEAWGYRPGKLDWRLVYRNADSFYDTDSEMRRPSFRAPPAPPALEPVPDLEWSRGELAVGFHPAAALDLKLRLASQKRQGDKSSLLRQIGALGAVGSEAPDRKLFDTETRELRLTAAYAAGRLDSDADLVVRTAEGDRTLGARQVFDDDQQSWRLNWNVGYALSERARLFGGLQTAQLTDEGDEVHADAMARDSETTSTSGRAGVISRLGRNALVRLSALVGSQETDARISDAGGLLQAVDRQYDRTQLQASATYTGLAKARVNLRYRYRRTELDENTSESDLPGGAAATMLQTLDRTATRHDLKVAARRRLGRHAKLVLDADWQKLEVEETTAGDAWLYRLGDRNRERLGFDLGLQVRPNARWRLDAGVCASEQTIERVAMDGVETTWSAQLMRLNLNWFASDRLTVYGAVSYGGEELDLSGDPAADGTLGAVTYEGTTLRFAPGATLQLTPRLLLEACYEGVRFEDDADASAALDAIEADSDRTLLRARWSAPRDLTVTATYRRHEFDENRWDDYIHDLYVLSISRDF